MPETPECAGCGLVLTPEDVAKAGGVGLCQECYDLQPPVWEAWRLRAPEATDGET